jgi:hypothetical protein
MQGLKMSDPTPYTFTDAEGRECALQVRMGTGPLPTRWRHAQLPDLIAALTTRGYAVVPVLGTEPTDEERKRIYVEAYLRDTSPSLPTLMAGPSEIEAGHARGTLALFLAGSASREPEIDELRASERAARERVKELEARVVDLEAQAAMACIEPDPRCQCAGCLHANEEMGSR